MLPMLATYRQLSDILVKLTRGRNVKISDSAKWTHHDGRVCVSIQAVSERTS